MCHRRSAGEAVLHLPRDGLGAEIHADEFLITRRNCDGVIDQEEKTIRAGRSAVHAIA